MAQLAYHAALTLPAWKKDRVPAGDRLAIQRKASRPIVERDFRSLQLLAAHLEFPTKATLSPDIDALFSQSLRNLWAVKSSS